MKTAERKTHKRCAVVRSVPSPWNGRREQILLDNKRGWKSTKIRPKAKCFLLTSPLIEPTNSLSVPIVPFHPVDSIPAVVCPVLETLGFESESQLKC
jgi:hypothetical protein